MKVIPKPWGCEEIIFSEGSVQVKILTIKKGEETSLQYHNEKNETAIALDENATIEYGGEYSKIPKSIDETSLPNQKILMHKGEMHVITSRQIHRFIAERGNTRIIELSRGNDKDIVRLQDKYKR